MSENSTTRRFIRESLPLLSSYFHSEQVLLAPVDLAIGEDNGDEEYRPFERHLRMRHALACGLELKPIIDGILRGVSYSSEIIRAEARGAIYGRLDIPLYLTRRGTNVSWPRTFPVLIAHATPNTPENQLVVDAVRELVRRLNEVGAEQDSAERAYCYSLLRWAREQLHSEPWARVAPARGAARLRRETDHRIRKRQTGNEPAYSKFMDWHKKWSYDPSGSDPHESEQLVDLLLAFPIEEFFEDRVFEIWCLQQLIDSFRRCGAVFISGPRPLFERSVGPICSMRYEGYTFAIWFQKALPSEKARWRYQHSGRSLGGIPDITVVGDDGRRLLVDAKRRFVQTQTRPEETYKMLGYMENFRPIFDGTGFMAALCFLSDSDIFTELSAGAHDKVVLVSAHAVDPVVCAFGGRMDTLVSEWLASHRGLPDLKSIEISTPPV